MWEESKPIFFQKNSSVVFSNSFEKLGPNVLTCSKIISRMFSNSSTTVDSRMLRSVSEFRGFFPLENFCGFVTVMAAGC